jgi:hypothetical protein
MIMDFCRPGQGAGAADGALPGFRKGPRCDGRDSFEILHRNGRALSAFVQVPAARNSRKKERGPCEPRSEDSALGGGRVELAGRGDLEISWTADVHMLSYCIAQGNLRPASRSWTMGELHCGRRIESVRSLAPVPHLKSHTAIDGQTALHGRRATKGRR